MSAPSALIFAPQLGAHRQTYVAVISSWLLNHGWTVLLATESWPLHPDAALLVTELEANPRFSVIATGSQPEPEIARSVIELEERINAKLTIFPAGDECWQCIKRLCPSPTSKRVVWLIYLGSCYRHDPSDLRFPMLGKLMSISNQYKRAVTERRLLSRQHCEQIGVSSVLSTNADAVAFLNLPHVKLVPEMYRSWGFEKKVNTAELDVANANLDSFVARHRGRSFLLFYGRTTLRRGYDNILGLCSSDNDLGLVRFGRDSDEILQHEVCGKHLSSLRSQGRILEINDSYGPERPFHDAVFKSCDCVPLPYLNFYGVSGSLIQATANRKPVVVPRIGFIGSTVERYKLGERYNYRSFASFRDMTKRLLSAKGEFEPNLDAFAKMLSLQSLHESFEREFSI